MFFLEIQYCFYFESLLFESSSINALHSFSKTTFSKNRARNSTGISSPKRITAVTDNVELLPRIGKRSRF